MLGTTSAKLIDEAHAAARKAEEIASHHAGLDLADRLRAAEEVIDRQKRQLLEAAGVIDKLLEVIRGRGRRV